MKNFKPLFSLEEFEETKNNPLYYDVPERIQHNLSELAKRLKIYQKLYIIVKGPILRIIRETMEEHDLLKESANPMIDYRAFLNSSFVTSVSLYNGLLKDGTPRELLKSEIKHLENVETHVVVSGYTTEETQVVDKVCETALAKARKESILQQFRIHYDSLILRLNQTMDMIRSEIKRIKKV